jgi:hypothetical protein
MPALVAIPAAVTAIRIAQMGDADHPSHLPLGWDARRGGHGSQRRKPPNAPDNRSRRRLNTLPAKVERDHAD